MIRIKEGVLVGTPSLELIIALYPITRVFDISGYDCWITSMADGVHQGKPIDDSGKDPHYVGKAADFRIHDIPPSERERFVEDMKRALGTPYVVLRENVGGLNEHLHIQTGPVKE